MKEIEIIPLALKKMERRGISRDMVIQTIQSPDQIVDGYGGRKIRQKMYDINGRKSLVRVVVDEENEGIVVITAYLTTQINRYWR